MKIIESLLTKACSELGVERINIWEYKPSKNMLKSILSYQNNTNLFLVDVDINGDDYPKYFKSIQNYEYILSNDAIKDPVNKELVDSYIKPMGIKSMLDIPYRNMKGEVQYLVCFEHLKKHQFSEVEVKKAKDYVKEIVKNIK